MATLAKYRLYLLLKLIVTLYNFQLTKRAFLLLSIVLLVFSCKKEVAQLSFSEVQITTKNNNLVEVFIPKASGNTSASKTINGKIESLVASRLAVGAPETNNKSVSVTQQIDAFNTAYQDFKKDFPETPQHWDAQINGEVMFQSTEVISIAITSYLNTGGAHGNTVISFLNFDTATGNEISKEALFTDIESFKTVAKQYFDNAVKDKSVLFEPDNFELPANIGFLEEGVIMLYNPYEIAPYSTGIIEFTIPFEKVNDYLVFNSL